MRKDSLLKDRISGLVQSIEKTIMRKDRELDTNASLLKAYSPDNTLRRGYSIVYKNGKTVNSSKRLSSGEEINIRMYEGNIDATVKESHDA